MKLVIAIVNRDDSADLIHKLNKNGFMSTRLSTTGGFLRAGNTTLLIGVDDCKLDGAMDIIEKVCRSRKQVASAPTQMSPGMSSFPPYPVEVMVGGATVFQLSVEQFKKF